MDKPREGLKAILAPAARRDIKKILRWSEEKFGKAAALRYEALLIQGLRDIEADHGRPGTSQRPELPLDVRLYHLAFSRSRAACEAVKEPRHYIVFRVTKSGLQIVRILHDRRDVALHLNDAK